ncbi:MAG: hypothetical protein L0H84_22385, partial [Pseudonocardia sp.]|nr:hypothetical protein [Pseudonocardia sp.]
AAAGGAARGGGVGARRPPEQVRESVLAIAHECALLAGVAPPDPAQLELVDARGPGFGQLTDLERDRAELAARTEGLLLDATYGAEAFSVAVDRAHASPPGHRDDPVVWWHTGGIVAALAAATAGEGAPR